MKIALVFPGQGSQSLGMGKDLFNHFNQAKEVFDEVDQTLQSFYGKKLSSVIFEGPEQDLNQTLYTQASIMAVSIACFRMMRSVLNEDFFNSISFVAGHSLGEYSALCAAGVLSLENTAKLLYSRGKAMQEAVPQGVGGMAAIIGLDMTLLEDILFKFENVYIANDNGNDQVVISGDKKSVLLAMEECQKLGAKRAISLNVSAPFHCPLMQSAAKIMQEKLEGCTFHNANIPVITNVDACPHQDPVTFKQNLVDQICGRVRWKETMQRLQKEEITHVIEVGPGKVLSNIAKRMLSDKITLNIGNVNDIEKLQELFH